MIARPTGISPEKDGGGRIASRVGLGVPAWPAAPRRRVLVTPVHKITHRTKVKETPWGKQVALWEESDDPH